MTKRQFRVEMIYRGHSVTNLKRHGRGDLDFILYGCKCVNCNAEILFYPQRIHNQIEGPMNCKKEMEKEGEK